MKDTISKMWIVDKKYCSDVQYLICNTSPILKFLEFINRVENFNYFF